jgi:predicted phosphodiesterase
MLIRLISDIHLEFGKDWAPALIELPEDSETVLVVAGDVNTGLDACEFLQQVSSRFHHVVYVMGNHEFYGNDLHLLRDEMREELSDFDKVTLLENESLVLGDVRFVGTTLWTNMAKENPTIMVIVEQAMADYGYITKNGGQRIFAPDTIALNKIAVAYLEEELAKEHDGATVVVTHHLPSFQSVHPMFHRQPEMSINPGFYSDLENLMHAYKIDYWLHGHTHQSSGYEVNGCKVRMNPLGYYSVEDSENLLFRPDWRIEV